MRAASRTGERRPRRKSPTQTRWSRWCSLRSKARRRKIERPSSCMPSKVSRLMKLRRLQIARPTRLSNQSSARERNCATALPRTTPSRNVCSKKHVNRGVLMITREDLRQLAEFECQSKECAISFYFQPGVPKDKSHREEGIQAKDMVRRTIQ